MKKRDLQRLQIKKLKALLRHAYENVPYYHEAFRREKFRPADLKCLADLCKVPVLKRSALREKLERLIAKNIPKKELVCRLTNGTTAVPVKFYRSKEDISWGIGAELRGYSWAGYEVGDKVARIWRILPDLNKSFKFKLENFLRRHKILNILNMSEKSMKSFARKMHNFHPDFIWGYSGSTNIFATFISQNDHFKIRPRAVITSCETLFPHYRKTIEETFNCKVYDYYGSSETSLLAAQCGQHDGLHIVEENFILEVVKNDELVSPSEEGRVLVTNLNSFAMPFIRYDIGDLGKIFSDTCSCGRNLSLFKPIGRNYERFVNSDGSFTALCDFQTVFEDLPIEDFQVVQESYDEITIRIVRKPGYTKEHTNFILKRIRYFGGAKIRVEPVDSILPEESGKIRHVVKKIATPYT